MFLSPLLVYIGNVSRLSNFGAVSLRFGSTYFLFVSEVLAETINSWGESLAEMLSTFGGTFLLTHIL